jgi:protein arginine phosphatase
MAEEIARMLVGDGLEVRSRSLSTDYEPPNSPANEQGQLVMRNLFGRDTSGHRSMLLSGEDMEWADHVIGVTKGHREAVVNLFPAAANKTTCFQEDIPDPWRGPYEDYVACAQQLHKLIGEQLTGLGLISTRK